jgi:hypothetical protein
LSKEKTKANKHRNPGSGEASTPSELAKALSESADKLAKAAAEMPEEPEFISGQVRRLYSKLIRFRRFLTVFVLILSGYSIATCFYHFPLTFLISTISVLSGLSLALLILVEIFKGAGYEIQEEFKQGNEYSRTLHFVPSLDNISTLLFSLGAAFLAVISGFSGVYAKLAHQNPSHFVGSLSNFSAVYFSLVTFATVGYGDIYPSSSLAQICVSIEIGIAMVLVAVVLATTISWVTESERRRHDEFIHRRAEEVKRREELLRRAKVGLYSDRQGKKTEGLELGGKPSKSD